MSREDVLDRVRAALGAAASRPRGEPPVLPPPQQWEDTVGMFVRRAEQVAARVERVAALSDVPQWAAGWCAARPARRVAVWECAELHGVAARLQEAGMDIIAPGAPPEEIAGADAGITGAEWGIAETGTLVLPATVGRPRLTSLLPPMHLAVLPAERILSDLHALFEVCGRLPSALTLITGPSRSADIGLVPVLGAHGPMSVTVLLVGARPQEGLP